MPGHAGPIDRSMTANITNTGRLHFLIPAYNEEDNLVFLFSNIRRITYYLERQYTIVLVNDFSTDGTSRRARELGAAMPVTVIDQPENRGPGAAFDTAFRHALERSESDDIFVTIEADNTSDLCVLGKMLESIVRGNDVVLASVYGSGKVVGAPLTRRLLSSCANILMRYSLGLRDLHTFSSFFRMYRHGAIQALYQAYGEQAMTERGFVCMVELLIKFRQIGVRVSEIPMLLDSNIRIGDSKMKIMRTTVSYFRVMRNHLLRKSYRPALNRADIGRLAEIAK